MPESVVSINGEAFSWYMRVVANAPHSIQSPGVVHLTARKVLHLKLDEASLFKRLLGDCNGIPFAQLGLSDTDPNFVGVNAHGPAARLVALGLVRIDPENGTYLLKATCIAFNPDVQYLVL